MCVLVLLKLSKPSGSLTVNVKNILSCSMVCILEFCSEYVVFLLSVCCSS